jgi:predicted dehydrogenase
MAKPPKNSVSRRSLLKGAAAAFAVVGIGCTDQRAAAEAPAAGAGPSVPTSGAMDMTPFTAGKRQPSTILNPGRVIGANDRIRIAVIGVGGQGFGAHLKGLRGKEKENNIEVIGASDVYIPRLERAKAEMLKGLDPAPTVFAEKDFRRLLDNKDIDAVVVATPEHWHAPVSLMAMDAGKHVYCEKPMTRHLDEAFALIDTVKRTGKVFQLGIQFTSDPKMHAVGEFIRSGKIGPLVAGQSSYCRNAGKKGEWNYGIDAGAGPDNLDWDMWLGSAPKRPWNDDSKERFFRYRKYWDYSAGILGDLMPHRMGPFLIASGNPEFPTRVTSIGSRNVSKDREVDDNVQVMAEFPSGWSMLFTGSTVNEQGLPDLFRGHKASVYFGGEGAVAKPERPYAEEMEETVITKGGGHDIPLHHKNWIDAIRTGSKLNCPVELGAKVQTILALAEMSSRANRMMLFDEKTRTVKAG